MKLKTVGDYWEQLRPNQRHFVLWCVRQFSSNRKGLNPALLPFIEAREAVVALQHRLDRENFGSASPQHDDPEEASPYVCHTRYIRHLISVLANGKADLNQFKEHADVLDAKDSTVMVLKTPKLFRTFHVYPASFFTRDSIYLHGITCSTSIEFVQRSSNRWQVTTVANFLDRITTALAEQCR